MSYHFAPVRMAIIQKSKILARMWYPTSMLVEMQIGAIIMENSSRSLRNLKIDLPHDAAIPLPGIYPKEMKAELESYLQFYVYNS